MRAIQKETKNNIERNSKVQLIFVQKLILAQKEREMETGKKDYA